MNLENPALWRFDTPPVEPRLAATVLCVRPGGVGFEILMMKRPENTRFASLQFVFPGGKVDEGDASEKAEECAPIPGRLLEPEPLRRYPERTRKGIYRAALRELAEEVGFLVTPQGISLLERPLFSRAEEFYEYLLLHNLRLSPEQLYYWVNWVTPKPAPIRYDTHFFVLFVPQGIEPRESEETVSLRWFHPREALRAFKAGEIELLFPTYKSLEQLASLQSLKEFQRFIEGFPKLRIEPDIVQTEEQGIAIELPPSWPLPKPWE